MKIAYFDCTYGAGGDMLLGALLDSGLSVDLWLSELNKIALPKNSYEIAIEQVTRCSITAKKLKVLLPHAPLHSHDHNNHVHHHDHEHAHDHEHSSVLTKHKHSHRGLKEITQIIQASKFSTKATNLALAIFNNLAKAEGAVHGIDPQEVHFHEVGAIDSIIDIVGFALAYDLLEIERSIISPLPLGSGIAQTEHGLLPIPGPAVLNLLQQAKAPISNQKIDHECLTPTAAAILTTIANDWGQTPALQAIDDTGYGAGDRDPKHFPNVCRVIIGNSSEVSSTVSISHSPRFNREQLAVVEVMLDDFSPQSLAYTTEKLLSTGALDTYVIPITAKKGRSGHLVTVICKPTDTALIEELIFDQTSTLGLRVYLADRLFLEREWITVDLEDVQIRVKIARDLNGKIINAQPEYEDCALYAKSAQLPLKEVLARVMSKCDLS